MRYYLAAAPRWVTSALQGIVFGLLTGLTQHHSSAGVAVVSGVFSGVLFAFFMHWTAKRRHRKNPLTPDGLTAGQRQEVIRSANAGPAPTDPELRGAARDLVIRRIDERGRRVGFGYAVWVFLAGLGVYLSVSQSAWNLIYTALFADAGIQWARRPRRLQERLRVLSS